MLPDQREPQEMWAQKQLEMGVKKYCVQGLAWGRVKGAYRCEGMEHLITDELLVEGKGGCYVMAVGAKLSGPVWGRAVLWE
jgi:hypothetical protein